MDNIKNLFCKINSLHPNSSPEINIKQFQDCFRVFIIFDIVSVSRPGIENKRISISGRGETMDGAFSDLLKNTEDYYI